MSWASAGKDQNDGQGLQEAEDLGPSILAAAALYELLLESWDLGREEDYERITRESTAGSSPVSPRRTSGSGVNRTYRRFLWGCT